MQDNEARAVDYSIWIGRVISWDGLLPCFVSALSLACGSLFPNNQLFAELLMVGLPIAAFLFRFSVGTKQIRYNYCSRTLQYAQLCALTVAIFLMIFVDFMIVLFAFVPKKNRPLNADDISVFAVMILVYIILVLFAMYPGRRSHKSA